LVFGFWFLVKAHKVYGLRLIGLVATGSFLSAIFGLVALMHLTFLGWVLSLSLDSKKQEVVPMSRKNRPCMFLLSMGSAIWAIEVGVVANALPT
jgi:hypothetical protein